MSYSKSINNGIENINKKIQTLDTKIKKSLIRGIFYSFTDYTFSLAKNSPFY